MLSEVIEEKHLCHTFKQIEIFFKNNTVGNSTGWMVNASYVFLWCLGAMVPATFQVEVCMVYCTYDVMFNSSCNDAVILIRQAKVVTRLNKATESAAHLDGFLKGS